MIKVYPSILTNDIKDFKRRISRIKFAKTIQIDIMDGKFVKNKSLMPKDLRKIKIRHKLEYHLMIKNPEEIIDEFLALKPYSIVIHYESTKNIIFLINKIKSRKIKVGIAINPKTPVKKIIPYLKKVDSILIMTVNPGFYGSRFVPSSLRKIKELRRLTKKPIEVDGHQDYNNAKLSIKAGANIIISGSYIFDNNPLQSYKSLLTLG